MTGKEVFYLPKKDLKTSEAQRKASAKWERDNADKITIKMRKDGHDGFTKEDIKSAAYREGMSVNAWILAAIRDKF